MELSRFHMYDALSPPVQQGWPISDGLIVSYDRISTTSTETDKAENMRMVDDQSSIEFLCITAIAPLAISSRLYRMFRYPLLRGLGGRHLSIDLA